MKQYQEAINTQKDRYKDLFSELLPLYNPNQSMKILSFGCSIGEEVCSLKSIFSAAEVIGCDVNISALEQAESKYSEPNFKFIESTPDNIEMHGPYDLITAMSVFCKWPYALCNDNLSNIFPFDEFDSQVLFLTSLIKPGGCFILYNSNFFFEDTKSYVDFKPFASQKHHENGFVYKFAPDNRKLTKLNVEFEGNVCDYKELLINRDLKMQYRFYQHIFIALPSKNYDFKTCIWIKI